MSHLGERLRYAREKVNLTLSQVKGLTGIGESSISEFENNIREPKVAQLTALATAYRRSMSFFLAEGPLPYELVLWRERPEENAQDIERQFLSLCEQYHNLECWCKEIIEPSLPEATGDVQRFGIPETVRLAKRVQDDLQLGDRPAFELLSVLEEQCGVKVFFLDFEPSGTAAASRNDESFGYGILLNGKNAPWRRNFDLAHELFHLLTWHVFRHDSDKTSSVANKEEEKLADVFASNLLLPEEALRIATERRLVDNKLGYAEAFAIAREFDVSVDALMWRLHRLYNHPSDGSAQTQAFIEALHQRDDILETRERDIPVSIRPGRFRALAIKALMNGDISTGRCAEYLGISRDKAMRLLNQEISEGDEAAFVAA